MEGRVAPPRGSQAAEPLIVRERPLFLLLFLSQEWREKEGIIEFEAEPVGATIGRPFRASIPKLGARGFRRRPMVARLGHPSQSWVRGFSAGAQWAPLRGRPVKSK